MSNMHTKKTHTMSNKQPLDNELNPPSSHTHTKNTHTISNKLQPLDISESLRVFDNGLGIPKIKQQYLSDTDEQTIGFLLDCAERGKNPGNQRPPSICKVSRILRDLSRSSFIPHLVSIGPIHRENEKLKEFEWLKERYLNDLLNRCDSSPKSTFEACLLKVNTLIPQIRESYDDGAIENYSDDALARMMIMDGCFILEFCFKHDRGNWHLPNKMQTRRIAMDLILLENQVPFIVLEALFDCSMGNVSFTLSKVLDEYLAPYIKLFRSLLPEKISTTDVDSDSGPAHVLGYLHKRYQLVTAKSSNPTDAEELKLVDDELALKSSNTTDAEELKLVDEKGIENTAFHTIVELKRSGMNFKPHQEDEWSMTMKFQSPLIPCLTYPFNANPTLLMPTLVIDDLTELILKNFFAYEQSFPHHRDYFTSYAVAMDLLIDTQEDIAKLVKAKVLVNTLDSNQEAADMINNICNNMFVTDFYYIQEFKKMDEYCKPFGPTTRRLYFRNPWNAISLLFGIIVSITTVVSAIFTILEYFR